MMQKNFFLFLLLLTTLAFAQFESPKTNVNSTDNSGLSKNERIDKTEERLTSFNATVETLQSQLATLSTENEKWQKIIADSLKQYEMISKDLSATKIQQAQLQKRLEILEKAFDKIGVDLPSTQNKN
jgi:chromosome segregation ATPase